MRENETALAKLRPVEILLTLSSQKVIKITAALISAGIAIKQPWEITSCKESVYPRKRNLCLHRSSSEEHRGGKLDHEAC